MPVARVRDRLLVAVGAVALALAAVWLYVQTRPRAAATAPAAVVVASDAERSPDLPHLATDATAPALPHQTPSERDAAKTQRTQWVQRAIASGSGREIWTDQGQELIDEIGRLAAGVEDSGCFLTGCTATYTFPSRASYDDAYREVTGSPSYAAWTGGKRWSTPEEQDDGRIIVALIIYRPN